MPNANTARKTNAVYSDEYSATAPRSHRGEGTGVAMTTAARTLKSSGENDGPA